MGASGPMPSWLMLKFGPCFVVVPDIPMQSMLSTEFKTKIVNVCHTWYEKRFGLGKNNEHNKSQAEIIVV